MKNILIFATLLALATACKKSYTCSCTVVSTMDGEVVSTSQSNTTIKDTKKNAKATCDGTNGTTTTSMGDMSASTTYSCTFEK